MAISAPVTAENNLALIRQTPTATAAAVIALAGAATILGAWFFQLVLGMQPCPLCLDQRIPYYLAIPLAAAVVVGALHHRSRIFLIDGLGVVGALMLASAAMAIYHSGIEWEWWLGPADCTGPLAPLRRVGGILKQIESFQGTRCDEVAWRFLYLSLAGWNAVISLGLTAVAIWGIAATWLRQRS